MIIGSQTIMQACDQKSIYNSKAVVAAKLVTALFIGSVIINQQIIAPTKSLHFGQSFSNIDNANIVRFHNTDDKYLRGSYSRLFDCDDDDCKHAMAQFTDCDDDDCKHAVLKKFHSNDDNTGMLPKIAINKVKLTDCDEC